jgi:hypothetical protein
MSAPSDGPGPADRDGISKAVDEMEERVVGRRVEPPRSDDITEEDEGDAPDGSGRGSAAEPS